MPSTGTRNMLTVAGAIFFIPWCAFADNDCKYVEYPDRIEVVCSGDGKATSSNSIGSQEEKIEQKRHRFGDTQSNPQPAGFVAGSPEFTAEINRFAKGSSAAREEKHRHGMELLEVQHDHELEMLKMINSQKQ